MKFNNLIANDFLKKKIFLILGLVILLISLLYIPYLSPKFTDYQKCLSISIALSIYGIVLLGLKRNLRFTLADCGWIGLVILTFLSAFWSTNPYYAIFGSFTTLLTFLSFKLFETIEWDNSAKYLLRISFFICLIFALSMISYAAFVPKSQVFLINISGLNYNFFCSLILVLMPLTLGVGIVVYSVGSLQAFLGLFFIGPFFWFYKTKSSVKKMTLNSSKVILIAMLAILVISFNKDIFINKFKLFEEFNQQNDRIEMWESSYKLFKKSPVIGIGKNNWKTEIGQFGLNNYTPDRNNNYNPRVYNQAHSWFFQTLSELGLLGFTFMLMILISCFQSLRNKINLEGIDYAAIFSITSFLWVGLMYGIVYNFFENFNGLTVLVAFCIAVLNRNSKSIITINSRTYAILIIIASAFSMLFFYTSNLSKKKYNLGTKKVNIQKANSILSSAQLSWDKSKIYIQQARVNSKLGNLALANTYYQKGLSYNPYDVSLLHKYSRFLFDNGNYSEAYHYSKKAYELCNRYLANEVLLIECLDKLGKTPKAIKRAKFLKELLNKKINKLKRLDPEIENKKALLKEKTVLSKMNTKISKFIKKHKK